MADDRLSNALGYIVEKSLVDAYIEVIEKHPDGGDQGEYSTNDEFNVVNSGEELDGEKSDECIKKFEEATKVTSNVDGVQRIKFTSLNALPYAKGDTDTEVNIIDDKHYKDLGKQATHSDYEASVESDDTGEVNLGRQDVIAESNFENNVGNDALENQLYNGKVTESKSPKVTSSTPIKDNNSAQLLDDDVSKATKRILLNEFSSNNKLSSNLAVMIGNISGIENEAYSDGHVASPVGSTFQRSQKAPTVNERTEADMPSTLDLSDLDIGSVDSYKEFSLQERTKSTDGKLSHQNGFDELRKHYDNEVKQLKREKDELMSILTLPNHESTLVRLHFAEDAKNELEKRCFQSERRNHEISMENRRLQTLCCELERKNRLLEADKTILQERNFKIDQDRRKASHELSAVQELLNSSLSDRRHLEDELFYAKKKELNSSSRLNESDAALRELREDLNRSKRDSDEKDETIINLTAQKQEIQSNLNDALEQIDRLEDASSQRAKEKDLFRKLLEEYEVLYNQHHRIRSLYNDTLQRLDDNSDEISLKNRQSKGFFAIKAPTRGSSYRKKWSMSPTSPSLMEQQQQQQQQKEIAFVEHHSSPSQRTPRTDKDSFNRRSLDSQLTENTDWNCNEATSDSGGNPIAHAQSNGPRRLDYSTATENQRLSYQGSHTAYLEEGDLQQHAVRDRPLNKDETSRKEKDWLIQNVNGITRFDVVFSPSNLRYEAAEREIPKANGFNWQQHRISAYAGKERDQDIEADTSSISLEIAELERDLTKLSAEKSEIESQLSRLPTGGSGRARRSNAEKKELLEERLDELVKYISNIKMALKRHKVL